MVVRDALPSASFRFLPIREADSHDTYAAQQRHSCHDEKLKRIVAAGGAALLHVQCSSTGLTISSPIDDRTSMGEYLGRCRVFCLAAALRALRMPARRTRGQLCTASPVTTAHARAKAAGRVAHFVACWTQIAPRMHVRQ